MNVTSKNIFTFLFIFAFFSSIVCHALVNVRSVYAPPSSSGDISWAKRNFIRNVIGEFRLENLGQAVVIQQIYDEIGKQIVLVPTVKADTRDEEQLKTEALKQLKDVYEPVNKVRSEAEKKAAGMFNQFKFKEIVTVRYRKSGMIYFIKGRYYGCHGTVVRIGTQRIPMVDVLEDDLACMDQQLAKEKRKKYVDSIVSKVVLKNNHALETVMNQLRAKIEEDNLKAGYIMYNIQWCSAKEYADIQIRNLLKKQQNARLTVSERLLKLREFIAAEKNRLANVKGIDGDPGLDLTVFWDFEREDVFRAYRDRSQTALISGKEYDRVPPNSRDIESIRIYYDENGRMNRVRIYYIQKDIEMLEMLKKQFIAKYGPDDREKNNIANLSNDPYAVTTWTGTTTIGRLVPEINKSTGKFESLYFEKLEVNKKK